MKNYLNLKLSLLCLMIGASSIAFAQRGMVPAPFQADYNKMMTNQAMRMPFMVDPVNVRNDPFFMFRNNEEPYNFRVFFKDSTKMFVTSFIYADSAKRSFYIIAEDRSLPEKDPKRTQKIYPVETASIIQFNDSGNLTGVPTDSCWLFKVISGKISVYSQIPKAKGLKNDMITASQVGNGPVDKFYPLVLYPIIKEDHAALNEWSKEAFINAIKKYNKDNQGK